MCKKIQLITLYCAVCHYYNIALVTHAQRCSNNFCPKFTDEECITIFIWGICNQKFDVKACYEFIKEYYGEWFPDLPSYQAFNHRICFLADAIKELASIIIVDIGLDPTHTDFVMDSLPIVVAGGRRSGRATVAADMCNKGYCASKDMWYYGVKLFILAQCNSGTLPTPAAMNVSKASEHDLPIAKDLLEGVEDIRVFCDSAFVDEQWQAYLQSEHNVEIITPIKRKKGQKKLSFWDGIFSSAVSSVKQVIESFNNWIIEKSNIQKASKVRSSAGLTAFIYARIACALFFSFCV